MAITPKFLEGSIVVAIVGYIIAFAFQVYILYLNYKQSKVNNQMVELIDEVKSIRNSLDSLKKPKPSIKKKK